jgi:hypothetical protein
MKKITFAVLLILILILATTVSLIHIKGKKEHSPSKPINGNPDKRKIEKPENKILSQPVKENKSSPAPDKSSPDLKVNPNIPDLQDKPEPVRTLLDPGKDDTERNEASNLLRAAGYKGLTDDLIASLREEILNPKL